MRFQIGQWLSRFNNMNFGSYQLELKGHFLELVTAQRDGTFSTTWESWDTTYTFLLFRINDVLLIKNRTESHSSKKLLTPDAMSFSGAAN